jgi:hypothetical protein
VTKKDPINRLAALNRCRAKTVRLYPSSRDGVPERRDNQSAIPRAIL